MKKLLLIASALLFVFNTNAYTTKIRIKTSKIEDACSSRNLNDFSGLQITYLQKLNIGLSNAELKNVKVTHCSVLEEAKVLRDRRVRRGKIYPRKIKKGQIELELTFLQGVEEYCQNSEEHYFVTFGGVTVISNDQNLRNLKALGMTFLRHYHPGLGYGQVDVTIPSCAIEAVTK
ncbi:hypothetical protein A9Q84_00450 [Halobacteriovorax marinus]|uniref:Secreted protein n=1 Tax=Halobacteriovorax marinus TaxID=97084 RepID=A0A1Y5FBD4_9BACT|nr:hypothetical protein A9Q84_00450 [Halobacteriovorax marinus]